ncbi:MULTISPECIES: hypothetical protein [Mesorhizobium]|uniref:Uncharacterized protein n=2 Tax=Mesorhizobium TaxID=68287 RepID=A0A271LT98_9HYPH|nr:MULTISPECIES: hypothetical protein [Mesorhizobium]RUV32036.1 hypothetical protein EOA86_03970 [Mesorhizobium sp. M5C.F.Ca.IN.020.32.2.1]RUV93773.1 hypothetical protein EOA88_06640 [Mesorhizobium sp. M5C.F.Ca.IN.020.14.1.1]PAQ11402.1 hypothetical protein CIT26_05260 [Mesorhizobium temperatum]RWD53150.1 MAG: hypothetical protein EOS59_01160 [Mesorhizobium sp.]RWE12047.1 MAG: hypothetical protein EOS23_09215 [Mesorhizobium sp.]
MPIDDVYMKSFQNQVQVLENMKTGIEAAIGRAQKRLAEVEQQVNEGKSTKEAIEDVFKKK